MVRFFDSLAVEPLLETVVAICFCCLSASIGYSISRFSRRASEWVSFVLVVPAILIALSMHFQGFHEFNWLTMLTAGRGKYIILSLTVPAIVFALYRHAKGWTGRGALAALLTISTVQFSVMPFLLPAFVRNELLNLETKMYGEVCLQGTDYTCGPAALVTALRKLGIRAEEGQLALAARSTPLTGTPADQLMIAVDKCYGSKGISSVFRRFESVQQLKGLEAAVVAVRLSTFKGHYLTVLEVTDSHITVADPECGKQLLTHEEFAKRWKYSGIVLKRQV